MRRFRIEVANTEKGDQPSAISKQVDRIMGELQELRQTGGRSAPLDNAIAVWSSVEDIQRRVETTKTEIAALYSKGMADPQKSRAADELHAVVTGTESATDAILAAAETIDTVAQELADTLSGPEKTSLETINEQVLQIYEACNFQDITGQRITKVVSSLRFIEERISTMVDLWNAMELAKPEEKDESDRALLNGPSLDTDRGVVNQDDVDALFR
ncbi:MAG: protein phosphatase CheZ [Pseudomonadota bacterium]